MKVSAFQYVLWLLPTLLQAAVVGRMLVKRLYRDYPIFFAFTIFHVVQATAGFVASRQSITAYFWTYWLTDCVDTLLSIAVVQEVFSHVLRPYEALRTLGSVLFRWAAGVLILLCFVAAAVSPGADQDRVMAGFLVLQRSTMILVGGLLMLLFIFSRVFGLAWRKFVIAIATGVGLIASVGSAVYAVRANVGNSIDPIYNVVQPMAYNLAVFIWVWSTYSKDEPVTVVRRPERDELLVWNRALQELLNR